MCVSSVANGRQWTPFGSLTQKATQYKPEIYLVREDLQILTKQEFYDNTENFPIPALRMV